MTGADSVYKAEERLQAILKVVVVGGLTQDPASLPGSTLFLSFAALIIPLWICADAPDRIWRSPATPTGRCCATPKATSPGSYTCPLTRYA